jgi:hypothetical protein
MSQHLITFNYETLYTGVILEGQSAVQHPLGVSRTPNFTQQNKLPYSMPCNYKVAQSQLTKNILPILMDKPTQSYARQSVEDYESCTEQIISFQTIFFFKFSTYKETSCVLVYILLTALNN